MSHGATSGLQADILDAASPKSQGQRLKTELVHFKAINGYQIPHSWTLHNSWTLTGARDGQMTCDFTSFSTVL